VGAGKSKAIAMWLGFSVFSIAKIDLKKPYIAPVGKPELVVKGGRAKKLL
jgi:hypothetical protein